MEALLIRVGLGVYFRVLITRNPNTRVLPRSPTGRDRVRVDVHGGFKVFARRSTPHFETLKPQTLNPKPSV